MSDPWRIEQLDRRHDRTGFDCGVEPLNEFLRKHARQNATNNISRTYVAVKGPSPAAALLPIHGYFTLAAGRVNLGDVASEDIRALRLGRHPVPVVLLGRLAVDRRSMNQNLGRRLLIEALERAHLAAQLIGAAAVEVHAKDERAKSFYKRYGFVPLVDDENHLWLAMRTIEQLLNAYHPDP